MKKELKWWQKCVVYELYPKSFQDTDGDGIGNIKGVTMHLDHLAALSVGAVWMTPVYPSPMVDNGYDIADYRGIHPVFGTMEDMDELLREAKKRNIRIVMDLVFNHSSDRHPWFLESKSGKDREKSDWYIWRDGRTAADGSRIPPTNWRSIFGGPAWEYSEERGQYYLHTFAKEQPDLNWENPAVRRELYEVIRFWLDKGVGGFRIDAIPYIKKPFPMEDGEPDGADGMASVHRMTVNTPGILDFLHEMRREAFDGHDIFTVGEAGGVSPEELPDWVGNGGVFDMIFEFSHVDLAFSREEVWVRPDKWNLLDLKRVLRESQAATKDEGWYPIYFENHDKPRCVNHFFPKGINTERAAKAMGTLLMTLRGTPFLYEGQEIAMENVNWDSISDYNDISSHGQYEFALSEGYSEKEIMEAVKQYSRDSARTPMQWTAGKNSGFSEGTPWLPANDRDGTRNVEVQEQDPKSVLNWYRLLARLRQSEAALTEGSYEELLADHEQIIAFRRGDLIILINMTEREALYDPGLTAGLECLADSWGVPGEGGRLSPLEAVIFKEDGQVKH